jgi:hypothetical protein
MIIMNGWTRAIAYASLVVVVLGFCLYVAFNYLISVAPSQLISGYEVTYLLSTILSDMLPWFFWTEICFIVVGMGAGLYMGSHIIVKKRWKDIVCILVFIFGPAFLLAFWQNVTFFFLSANIPYGPIGGLGTTSVADTLDTFFLGCAPILFCFVVASIAAGLYIGARETKKQTFTGIISERYRGGLGRRSVQLEIPSGVSDERACVPRKAR